MSEFELSEEHIGIPTFLIISNKGTSSFIEHLPSIIGGCENYQNAIMSLHESFKKHIPPINEQFSIAYKPLPRPNLYKSDVFVITSSLNDFEEELFLKHMVSYVYVYRACLVHIIENYTSTLF